MYWDLVSETRLADEQFGLSRQKLCDWNTHGVSAFSVGAVRRGRGGIVTQEDEGAGDLGKAHGLVRGPSFKPTSTEWRAIRPGTARRGLSGGLDDQHVGLGPAGEVSWDRSQ